MGEPSEMGEAGPGAILAVQREQGMLLREIVRLHVRLDHRHCAAQFLSILTVAGVAKTSEPLVGVGLQHRRAGTHDFPPLTPSVTRSTQGTQAARWGRSIYCLRQGPLTSV